MQIYNTPLNFDILPLNNPVLPKKYQNAAFSFLKNTFKIFNSLQRLYRTFLFVFDIILV